MTIDEFTNTTKQLENFYGKEMIDEQKQIWFKELRNLDIARVRYIIAQVYRTSKFMPKLADILEINSNLGYSQVKKESQNKKCDKCKGTGYILYDKVFDNGTGGKFLNKYGAICTCRQKQKYEGWKITDQEHRTIFYTPYAEEVGIGE